MSLDSIFQKEQLMELTHFGLKGHSQSNNGALRTGAARPLPYLSRCGYTRHTSSNEVPAVVTTQLVSKYRSSIQFLQKFKEPFC